MTSLKVIAGVVLLLAQLSFAQTMAPPPSAGLAATPPMGWNSWNKFGCDVSDKLIRETADAIVRSGMKDAGYQYVVIDDCWQVGRDREGNILPDPQRFPDGMKALGDYIHSRGLKFGIYAAAGTKTWGARPGSLGHEYQDALRYAEWGVDYLKYDWCNTTTQDAKSSYANMRAALDATGRPIVLSICEWGTAKPWLWGKDAGGNLWRTTGDIKDRWAGEEKWPDGTCCNYGVLDILDRQIGLESFAGPHHWNDPDMLEVGNGGMTETEYRAHFSLWAMLAAPLIAGNDVRTMPDATRQILLNKEAIALDQDPLGMQGKRVKRDGEAEVWSRPLADGGRAVVLLNRGKTEQPISVSWSAIGLENGTRATVRDLWQHKDLGSYAGTFNATVAPHSVVMITIRSVAQ
jgi:alpha-galactosidase